MTSTQRRLILQRRVCCTVQLIIFHQTCMIIDEEIIYNSASKTKGSAWPSGMDSELYRRILCSKNFKTEGKILREEIAVFTRNLFKKSYHPSLLEAFTSCRLIPLDKNPGIRPIGVGEVLRRIVGKNGQRFLKGGNKRSGRSPTSLCWS